jgi:exo-beta-1,3-glucanase (GH17 family)
MLPVAATSPGDGVAQRGLAHAVAAHDAQHAVVQRQAHALQRVGAAVVDVQAFDDQHRALAGWFGLVGEPGHQCLLPM